ncbi:YrhB domain-containing protein [Streptomyces sp. SM14]|uniref:YrhB domain-containing protein n=1 Tax=Streptomyces sp. SM14 TaxID=1736045 RepID=UPI000CD4E965|nr:YrhB domain-containing protein [Streptomyces sp. SM14]
MVSREDALRIAVDHLHKVYEREGYAFVAEPALTQEYRSLWAVRFDTQESRDTGDMTKAPFVRVLLVPKDGGRPWFPPTALPLGDYVAQFEASQ